MNTKPNPLARRLTSWSAGLVLLLSALALTAPPAAALNCTPTTQSACTVADCATAIVGGDGCYLGDGCLGSGSNVVCYTICGDAGDGVGVQYKTTDACVELCGASGLGVGVQVKTANECVDYCLDNSGEGYGLSLNGNPTACIDPNSVGLCPSGYYGVVVGSTQVCVPTQLLASCSGSDIGEVVAGVAACAHACTSGAGVVLNGAPQCHTLAVCPSGTYGVALDGSGCHTLTACPAGQTGYELDGSGATCVTNPHVPTVGLCPSGFYGVTVDGSTANCHTLTVCGSGTYGVSVDGSACHTVEVCAGSTIGGRVDGVGLCTPSPVGSCPNGRKGVVVAGQEVCPVP